VRIILSFCLLYGLAFFIGAASVPWMADDYFHATWTRGSDGFLVSLFNNLNEYYVTWGGRVLAHFVAALLLSFQSPWVFAFFNTIVFGALIFILQRTIQSFLNPSPVSFKLSVVGAIFITAFGTKDRFQTLYWITGSANYLWTSVLFFWFLYLIRDFLKLDSSGPTLQIKGWKLLGVVALGVATGAANENMGLALIGALLCIGFLRLLKTRTMVGVPALLVLLIPLTVGSAFLLKAPGNYMRMAVAFPNGLPSFSQRLLNTLESILVNVGRPEALLIWSLPLLTLWYHGTRWPQIWPKLKQHSAYLLIHLLMSFAYVGNSGSFTGRKAFALFLVFSLFIMICFTQIVQNFPARTVRRISLSLLLLAGCRYVYDMSKVIPQGQIYAQREAEIRQQVAQGTQNIKTCSLMNIYKLEDLQKNPAHWVNASLANWYGVATITADLPCD
jgi:hypothetical protein